MGRNMVALALGVAACTNPPLAIQFDITSGAEDACYAGSARTTTCAGVAMPCPAVVSLRVYTPGEQSTPFINICQPLAGDTACAIGNVQLTDPAQPIPAQTLEVDLVVYAGSGSDFACPTSVDFDANGFPVASDMPCNGSGCAPTPALGGRAYYHPGDSATTVHLGCVDISQLDNESCSTGPRTMVAAVVDDFVTGESVDAATAMDLDVEIGQPQAVTVGSSTEYQLSHGYALDEVSAAGTDPAWSDDVPAAFTVPCLYVLDQSTAQTTPTLTCRNLGDPPQPNVDIVGWRLPLAALQQILSALGQSEFPDSGLVVGLVLDELGNPLANQVVTSDAGTIIYLDGSAAGGSATSSSGVFVSTDAAFGTTFEVASGSGAPLAQGYGGLVEQRVTIVVLQVPGVAQPSAAR